MKKHHQLINFKAGDFYSDFFLWKYYNIYLELFVCFTNFSISGEEFTEQFLNQLENNLTVAIELSIHSKDFGFSDLLSQIFFECDAFVSDELLKEIEDVRKEGEIDENQLRAEIEKVILIKIFTKYYKKDFPILKNEFSIRKSSANFIIQHGQNYIEHPL